MLGSFTQRNRARLLVVLEQRADTLPVVNSADGLQRVRLPYTSRKGGRQEKEDGRGKGEGKGENEKERPTSAKTPPTSSTSSLFSSSGRPHFSASSFICRTCSSCGTVLVTTTLSRPEWKMRSTPSPLNTPWVTRAKTLLAPVRLSSFAARVMVFEVSARSSTMMQTLPLTLPTSNSAELPLSGAAELGTSFLRRSL